MYHPYQHQVAKRIVKERREHADIAQRVAEARGDQAKPWIRLRDRIAILVSSRSDRLDRRKNAAQRWAATTHVSALTKE
jgi:hypothetical protein